jgi:D-alanyl-D-alanine endopeptidase (penicillin-binding protein 7)
MSNTVGLLGRLVPLWVAGVACALALTAPVEAAQSAKTQPRRQGTQVQKKVQAVRVKAQARVQPSKPAKLTLAKRSASSGASRRRARAAAQALALAEAREPHFKFDDSGALVPDVRAAAAIIYDPSSGQVLWELNSQVERSIASITKVMTAAVVLETPDDLGTVVEIQRADVYRASTTYIRAGDRVTREDLLHLLLIGSDNAAARVLARTSALGSEGFVRRMNEKAAELGLASVSYVDPAGVYSANVASAFDMAKLITWASDDPRMSAIMRTPVHSVNAGRRIITVSSTNQLVKSGDVDVQAGKTGFIRTAGYCLATLLRLPRGGAEVAVVVLGAKSNAGRFWETRHLLNWLSTKAEDLLGGAVHAASPQPPPGLLTAPRAPLVP